MSVTMLGHGRSFTCCLEPMTELDADEIGS